jgi:hypothetical protein
VEPPQDGNLPHPRRPPAPRPRQKDNPSRQYNRPPDAKLLDIPGLLIVAGLALAGLLLAMIITRHVL